MEKEKLVKLQADDLNYSGWIAFKKSSLAAGLFLLCGLVVENKEIVPEEYRLPVYAVAVLLGAVLNDKVGLVDFEKLLKRREVVSENDTI